MIDLKMKAQGQKLSRDAESGWKDVCRGSTGLYRLRFSFDAVWDGYHKAAGFTADGETDYEPVIGGCVSVPDWLSEKKRYSVAVIGEKDGSRITTDSVEVKQR